MQKTRLKQSLSFILCIVLMAATALFTTGCHDNTTPGTNAGQQQEAQVLGVGKNEFTFTVTDGDGQETVYEIHTDKTVVGEALFELGLIAGENDQYGLFVKTVAGLTVDFDKDGKYWAFYENGKYAMSGVDTIEIVNGATYSFKVE